MVTATYHVPRGSEEYQFDDSDYMITRNDTDAKVIYANPTFVRVSGYSLEELKGSPSNLLYHPDVPKGVTEDLWKTLKSNGSWTGIMKHRRKSGEYFWAIATITPTIVGGRHTGYTTVRTRPTARQIEEAELAYERIKSGTRKYSIRRGRFLRAGVLGLIQRLLTASIATTLGLNVGLVVVSAAASAALLIANTGSHLRTLAFSVSCLSLALQLFLSVRLKRAMIGPLSSSLATCRRLAAGDLTCELPHVDSRDEMGELTFSLGLMRRSLLHTVSEALKSIETVGSSSRQIAEANVNLSARTEQQATAIEQTAATMEELTSAVQNNADGAQRAASLASEAASAAATGSEAIAGVQGTMTRILESAGRVSGISAVIEGIAFQTNILALNAAVEAARAGTEGKGFAVVATEVRSLAQRSAAAAKEIKELLSKSAEQTQEGVKVVAHAQETMQLILQSARGVSQLILEIAAASDEQGRGIAQVGSAVTQIEQTTQQNAAMVEEAAAVASALNEQSTRLDATMKAFNIA